MGGDPAELAYGHALAMLGQPDAAAEVAITAMRRAGRARRTVLAHARHQATVRAGSDEPVDIGSLQLVVLDLPAVAATLASTRPPEERAALDIRARIEGDLAALGEALGCRPSTAADRTAAIADVWEAELDPALLAFSGAADCEGLAVLLDDAAPENVVDLLAVAPAVHAHTQDCVACTDRLRAMNSVRSFFSTTPPDVPAEVREASRISRRLRPSASPPPLFGDGGRALLRLSRPNRLAVAALAAIAAVAGLLVWRHDDSTSLDAELTRAKTSPLTIDSSVPGVYAAGLRISNPTDRAITFRVTAPEGWVAFSPDRGRVGPRSTIPVNVTLSGDAPEGDARTTVLVTTASGATTSREFVWNVQRPPELGTQSHGCDVTVNAVDDGDLTSLVLHWRDTEEHQIDITDGSDGYEATLEPRGAPITYWVTATDARGNQARTPDQLIAANAC